MKYPTATAALFIPSLICLALAAYYWLRVPRLEKACAGMANSDCGADGAAFAAFAWSFAALIAVTVCALQYVAIVRKRSNISRTE